MPARIFLSYRRSAPADNRLAHALRDGLVAAGHEVFIDTGMKIGVDWASTIHERIAWCDHFVALLSPEAAISEMVIAEVRQAFRRFKAETIPRLLPIWVTTEGRLGYELDAYLGNLQYDVCRDEADTARLLEGLLAAIGGTPLPATRIVPLAPAAPAVATLRPLPAAEPGGTVRASDPFYVRRSQDDIADAAAARIGGETLLIRAPQQWGKSALAIRYRDACRAHGKASAYVDFGILEEDLLTERTVFLTEVMGHILDELDLKLQLPPTLSARTLTRFMQHEILPRTPNGLALIFDAADRIIGRAYKRDFFGMLRGWHNRRAQEPHIWERLDLVVVMASDPWMLIDEPMESPFNVATPLTLPPLTIPQIQDLGERHGIAMTNVDATLVARLLGGQPYLTRLAFYRMVGGRGISLTAIDDSAVELDGPFGEHLRSILVSLRHRPDLKLVEAMKQVERLGSVPDEVTFERLAAAGLVRREGGRVVPSNMLYARFFRALT